MWEFDKLRTQRVLLALRDGGYIRGRIEGSEHCVLKELVARVGGDRHGRPDRRRSLHRVTNPHRPMGDGRAPDRARDVPAGRLRHDAPRGARGGPPAR